MINLKVALVLGGNPYDEHRVLGLEERVRDTLADVLEMDPEFVEVSRLACMHELGSGNYANYCALPSGHDGGHSSIAPRPAAANGRS